jgi:hypothetical protein
MKVSADRLAYISENFDKRVDFCNGNIVLNSEKARGSMPNNANVRYMGFAVLMKPQTFLDFAQTLPEKEKRQGTLEFLPSQARDPGWGPPSFYFDREAMHITGHEGRHRASLFQQACNELMLVHMFPKYERARHMTPEIINDIRTNMMGERGSWYSVHKSSKPLFDYAFVENEILTWD